MADEKVTTRGLIDADLGPLRRFTGILDSTPTEKRTYGVGDTAREGTAIQLNFKDIDVKEAVEPYHFPIYTIRINQSNRKKSRWGVFSEGVPSNREVGFNNIADQQYSSTQLDPSSPEYIKPSNRADLENCIGKRFGLVLTDGEDGRPAPMELYDGRADADKPTPAWTVYEIEGLGTAGGAGSSPLEVAIALLDGKTLSEFNKAALESPVIRSEVSLLQSIGMPPSASNSFANTMVAAGKFVKDGEGIFHKVA